MINYNGYTGIVDTSSGKFLLYIENTIKSIRKQFLIFSSIQLAFVSYFQA